VLASADYAPELARVLTHALTGAAETAAAASPFAVNGFFAGDGSVNVQAARQAERDRRGGVSLTGRFDPAAYPTLALPLAGGPVKNGGRVTLGGFFGWPLTAVAS
jgi:hypothetical protein